MITRLLWPALVVLCACNPIRDYGTYYPGDVGFPSNCDADAGSVEDALVLNPATPPPPISGGTLAVMADGTLVAADSDRDRVWVVDPGASAASEVLLGAGDEPGRVVEGPAGIAFVALRNRGSVAEIDVRARKVVARHEACGAPRGLAWSASRSALYVACATGTLARLTYQAGAMKGRTLTHPVDDLRDVVLIDDDVFVSTFRSASVYLVKESGAVLPIQLPPTHHPMLVRAVGWRMVATPTGALMVHQSEVSTFVFGGGPCGGGGYGGQVLGGFDAGQSGIVGTALTAVGAPSPQDFLGPLTLPVDLAVSEKGEYAIAAAGTRKVFRSVPNAIPEELGGFKRSLQRGALRCRHDGSWERRACRCERRWR